MKNQTAAITKPQISTTKIVISALATVSLVAVSVGLSLSGSAAQPTIELGKTKNFAVLAGAGITNTGPTTVSGTYGADLGSSPTFTFTETGPITTSGIKYTAASTAVDEAKDDLVIAYDDAAGRIPTIPVVADLGGQTLTPGVYNSASSLGLTGTLTLDGQGDPNAVFIFQAGSTLTTASASTIVLLDGTQACNVFWQVGSSATFGTNSSFVGHVFALTSITATTGATFQGQLLARNGAVTLDTNTIVNDACITPDSGGSSEPTATPTPEEPTATPSPERATDSGGQLPNTDAFNWITPLTIGLGVIAIGTAAYLIRRRRS